MSTEEDSLPPPIPDDAILGERISGSLYFVAFALITSPLLVMASAMYAYRSGLWLKYLHPSSSSLLHPLNFSFVSIHVLVILFAIVIHVLLLWSFFRREKHFKEVMIYLKCAGILLYIVQYVTSLASPHYAQLAEVLSRGTLKDLAIEVVFSGFVIGYFQFSKRVHRTFVIEQSFISKKTFILLIDLFVVASFFGTAFDLIVKFLP